MNNGQCQSQYIVQLTQNGCKYVVHKVSQKVKNKLNFQNN